MNQLTGDEARKLAETHYRLTLPTIQRWVKIEMSRRQNVAEHSFNVLVLALSLFDFMQGATSHNSFDRMSLVEWAIDHDMDEIETGDIPADFKRAVEALAPGKVDQAIENAMAVKMPSYTARKRGVKDSYPYDVVKIADKLEEILYNKKYGRDERAHAALVDALPLLRQRLLKAEKAHPRYDWVRARAWLGYFLYPVFHSPGPLGPRMSEEQVLGSA